MGKNYKVKNEDIQNTIVLVQMESGKVFEFDFLYRADMEKKSNLMFDRIYDGDDIKSVGVKVEMKNGDWVKTDGKSIASRNVTDAHFIEFLSKLIETIESCFKGMADYCKDKCDALTLMHKDIEFRSAITRLNKEYGY